MQLEDYYQQRAGKISFSRQQASDFAKQIADDFNPLHDTDAKRFCVPGDLLFAVALSRVGLSQKMQANFTDMVNDGVELDFPATANTDLTVTDSAGKAYLGLNCSGECSTDAQRIAELTRRYVEFSGQTFPHILVPLWKAQGVMINPARPLVIYESMHINLERLDFTAPSLEMTETNLDVQGRRGKVSLRFQLKCGDTAIGTGEKRMLLSGLRDYDQTAIDELIEFYEARKQSYRP